MVELVDLSDWKKQNEIIIYLHREHGVNISSRQWRIAVEKWNEKFAKGETDYYITHSNKFGYKATKEYQEAKIARNDYLKRACNMIQKAKACDKAFNIKNNLMFDFKEGVIK